jgi:cysteine sulfinate desulfinase/cysteine desulfurase-like protein
MYSFFTHDCVTKHNFNTIISFADDTTLVSLFTDNDETDYREEVRDLAVLCQENNLFLIVSKIKELIVDYRKRSNKLVSISSSLVSTSPTNYHGPNTQRKL